MPVDSSGYVVLLLIGYQGSGKKTPGQLVKATIVFSGGGEEQISFSHEGQYLNDLADSRTRRRCWRLVKRTLSPGDSVRFEVFTGIKGAGADTKHTGSWVFVLDPSADVGEIRIPDVGPKEYPIAKGRLVEVARTTAFEQFTDEIQQFIDNDEGM